MKNINTKKKLICNLPTNNFNFNLFIPFKNLSLEENYINNCSFETKLQLRKNKIEHILSKKRFILNNGCV